MKSNYDKYPFIQVEHENKCCVEGWPAIIKELNSHLQSLNKKKKIIAVECYQGVQHEEVAKAFQNIFEHRLWIDAETLFKDEVAIRDMIYPDVTDDRVFGYLTRLNIKDYFDEKKLREAREEIEKISAFVFLSSPASDYMNGTIVTVDGGWMGR